MPDITKQFPQSWGEDHVTKYIDGAIDNILATVTRVNHPAYPTIVEIDDVFKTMVDGLTNTESIYEAVLLMRSHSAFLAGSTLALGGQATESFMVIRGVLENALYALHIYKNNGAGEVWINRHRNEESLTQSRNQFSYANVSRTLRNENENIADVSEHLYLRAIDFGAHPNERASSSAMQIIDEDGKKKIKQNYLTGGTEPQIHAIKSGAQIGVCSLDIFRVIFRERFDILGLTERLDDLKKNL